MRVLHVVPPARGGMRRHVLSLLSGLGAVGCRCRLAYLAPALEEAGGAVAPWPAAGSVAVGAAWHPATAWRLPRLMRELEPEVVHCHGARAALAARLALALPGAPPGALVYTVHGASAPVSPRARRVLAATERRLSARVAAYVAVSRAVAAGVIRDWCVPGDRVHLVPNGVDPARFAALPPRDEACRLLHLDPARPVVGMVARLAPEKAPDLFLQAARLLCRLQPGVQFLLAGDGPVREALERQARGLGIAEAVRFSGHVADPRVALAALDVFVLPSRAEGFGLALLEAMAAGRAVVATAVGGMAEVIAHRRTGLLVAPGDPYGLARAAAYLLADAPLRDRLAAAARWEVAARYSLDRMVRRTAHVYALAARAPRAS